jgi:hypothetical protein
LKVIEILIQQSTFNYSHCDYLQADLFSIKYPIF